MDEQLDNIKVNFSHRRVNGKLRIVSFEDHGHMVCYVPSLNLSAYGADGKIAFERLKEVMDDFFSCLVSLSPEKANAELKKLGWSKHTLFAKRFEQTVYIDKDGILKNFNLSETTVIKEQLVTV